MVREIRSWGRGCECHEAMRLAHPNLKIDCERASLRMHEAREKVSELFNTLRDFRDGLNRENSLIEGDRAFLKLGVWTLTFS